MVELNLNTGYQLLNLFDRNDLTLKDPSLELIYNRKSIRSHMEIVSYLVSPYILDINACCQPHALFTVLKVDFVSTLVLLLLLLLSLLLGVNLAIYVTATSATDNTSTPALLD
ncbi:hypothetical protein BLOT_011123 [Blomia tropicalis]|nr:hypothetical protein BLOT_011123 [Blomia tropicalis]